MTHTLDWTLLLNTQEKKTTNNNLSLLKWWNEPKVAHFFVFNLREVNAQCTNTMYFLWLQGIGWLTTSIHSLAIYLQYK